MKYLFLLLAPVLLSSSYSDRGQGTEGKIYVNNPFDCVAVVEYKVCHDESCSRTTQATAGSNYITVSGWEEGSYFCWIKVSLGAAFSPEVHISSRCGSASVMPVVDCHGITKNVQASGDNDEASIVIF